MMSSARRFLSRAISFLILLKTLSHYADIAGIARVSKAYWCSDGKAVFVPFHQDIGLKALGSRIAVGWE
jgi:hypothetical protein